MKTLFPILLVLFFVGCVSKNISTTEDVKQIDAKIHEYVDIVLSN